MKTVLLSLLLIMTLALFGGGSFVYGATEAEQLQQQISEERNRLKEIDAEIAAYRAELEKVGTEKSTLKNALYRLDVERNKVLSDISYTKKRIEVTDLEINKLSGEIENTENRVETQRRGVADMIRSLHMANDTSPILTFLAHDSIGDFWLALDQLAQVRIEVQRMAEKLASYQVALADRREEESDRRSELLALSIQYEDQNAVLANSAEEKNTLLARTENKESEYQRLLREKSEARKQIEAEMREYESRLQFILDPTTIPPAGTPVFRWPLDNVIITQHFGYTQFAQSGAYNGSQHNGMDLGTPTGSKLYAPAAGVVREVGNTDQVPGCYSWGKWILVDHPNGLSSLFAHLSTIGVSPGQSVSKSDIVGYTGNTGYSTGPHLHWTVYVSDAVKVRQFNEVKVSTSCGAAKSPFSAKEGYLDPLHYLPAI